MGFPGVIVQSPFRTSIDSDRDREPAVALDPSPREREFPFGKVRNRLSDPEHLPEQRLLGVQAVFRLVVDAALPTVHHGVRHL